MDEEGLLSRLKPYCLWKKFSLNANQEPQDYGHGDECVFYDDSAEITKQHIRGFCCKNLKGEVVCSGAITSALHAHILARHSQNGYLSPDCDLVRELSKICEITTEDAKGREFLEHYTSIRPKRDSPTYENATAVYPVRVCRDKNIWVNVSSPNPRMFTDSGADMFRAEWTALDLAASASPKPEAKQTLITLDRKADAEFECVVSTSNATLSRMSNRMSDRVETVDESTNTNYDNFKKAIAPSAHPSILDALVFRQDDVNDMKLRLKTPFCDVNKMIALPADAFEYLYSEKMIKKFHLFRVDKSENVPDCFIRDIKVTDNITTADDERVTYEFVMTLIREGRAEIQNKSFEFDQNPQNPWIGYVDDTYTITMINPISGGDTIKYEDGEYRYCKETYTKSKRPPVAYFEAARLLKVKKRGKTTIPKPTTDLHPNDVIGVSLTFRSKPCAYAVLANIDTHRVVWSNSPKDEREYIQSEDDEDENKIYEGATFDLKNDGNYDKSLGHLAKNKELTIARVTGNQAYICCTNSGEKKGQRVNYQKPVDLQTLKVSVTLRTSSSPAAAQSATSPSRSNRRLAAYALVALSFPDTKSDTDILDSNRTSGLTSDATAREFGIFVDGAGNCGAMMGVVLSQLSNFLERPILLRSDFNPISESTFDVEWSPLCAPDSHTVEIKGSPKPNPRHTAFIPNMPYTAKGATIVTRYLTWHKIDAPADPEAHKYEHPALLDKLRQGKYSFTMDEWKKLGAPKVGLSNHIKVDADYFGIETIEHLCILDVKGGERICMPIIQRPAPFPTPPPIDDLIKDGNVTFEDGGYFDYHSIFWPRQDNLQIIRFDKSFEVSMEHQMVYLMFNIATPVGLLLLNERRTIPNATYSIPKQTRALFVETLRSMSGRAMRTND